MQRRIITLAFVIISLTIVWLIKHSMDVQGLSVIESNVDKQLSSLISQSPNLKGLSVGSRTGARMVGDGPSFTGRIEYQAELSGSSVGLLVYWEGDTNKCQITKIESHSTYSNPQILWER
jgi:hypothetical protein